MDVHVYVCVYMRMRVCACVYMHVCLRTHSRLKQDVVFQKNHITVVSSEMVLAEHWLLYEENQNRSYSDV